MTLLAMHEDAPVACFCATEARMRMPMAIENREKAEGASSKKNFDTNFGRGFHGGTRTFFCPSAGCDRFFRLSCGSV